MWVVDLRTAQIVGFVRFEDAVQEIFAVEVLPGIRQLLEIRGQLESAGVRCILIEPGAKADLPPIVFLHGASTGLYDPVYSFREKLEGRARLLNLAKPLLSQLSAPALGLIWRGIVGRGAERLALDDNMSLGAAEPIRTGCRKSTPCRGPR